MKITFYIIAVSALLFSCNVSTKGNWTEEDKAKFRTELETVKTEIEAGGLNFDTFIECAIEKAEQKFSSFEEADSDFAGCEAIGKECALQLIGNSGSKAGNWSEQDIKIIESTMDELRAEDEGNSELDAFYDCYSEKLMATYDSFYDADNDGAGCAELSQECMTELGIEF
ncbi:MAG: hypothetical protein ACJA1C_000642 [Crocinitomicaceae bacterium]|jgi:hypothetical protein